MNDEENVEDVDPSVPTELLGLHVELEENNVTAEAFKEAYGNGTR